MWDLIVDERSDRWALISAEHFNIDYNTAMNMTDFEVAEANHALSKIMKARKAAMPKIPKK